MRQQQSADGTEKFLFGLEDGNQIETVLIPAGDKRTICGLARRWGAPLVVVFIRPPWDSCSLRPAEIVSQVLYFQEPGKTPERTFTNIVFKAWASHLTILQGTVQAIRILTAEWGLGISPRRITVSTSGLVRRLEAFGRADLKVNRQCRSMPRQTCSVHRSCRLTSHIPSLPCSRPVAFPLAVRQRITFEYVLLRDVNDTLADAKRLVKLMYGLRCKINLLFNEIPGVPYRRPSEATIQQFQNYLLQHGSAFVRQPLWRTFRRRVGVAV